MNNQARRERPLLLALALGLGLFITLASFLGRATPNQALELTEETPTPVVPVWVVPNTAQSLQPPALNLTPRQDDALRPDPRIAALMTQITTGTVAAYERVLTGEEPVLISGQLYTLTTRNSHSGEPISQATRYVYERFQEMGLDVVFYEYTWNNTHSPSYPVETYGRNVVAERRGLHRPDEIYLITAHLDDMPEGPVAPGADDNASGSSAVLIAADLLRRIDFDCTLRFVLFTGEEQGLRGSDAYATAIAAAGDDVRAVINLDMIGYNSDDEPIVDLHARSQIPDSLTIAETFSQVVAVYNLNLAPEILVDDWLGDYSDNKSFWDQGYPAILAIEDGDDFHPGYHTVNDALDALDLDYFAEFVRAGVGAFAHSSCLSVGMLTGAVTSLDTALPLSATVTATAPTYTYTVATDSAGHYSITLPIYTFTLTARANLLGYQSAVVTNVLVLAQPATVQHLALKPWPFDLFFPIVLKRL